MRANKQNTRHAAVIGLCVFSLLLIEPSVVSAQSDTQQPPFVWSVAKSVLLDPTTYAPAAMSYTALRMDWNSSQPLFRAGYVEHNYLFTVSGRPNVLGPSSGGFSSGPRGNAMPSRGNGMPSRGRG